MGVLLALLRASGTLSLLAEAFRRLAQSVPAAELEPVIAAVSVVDRAFDVILAYASPAMPTRSCPRKARWVCARKMDWP